MMYTIYTLFKFLHVAAVILWIGGVCTLSFINLRLAREQDRAALPRYRDRAASTAGRSSLRPPP